MCGLDIYSLLDESTDNAVDFGTSLIALLQGVSPVQLRLRTSFTDDTASVEWI